MVRAVLCDLDDTLFDHWRCTRVALEALRSREEHFARWPLDELAARHRVLLERWHLEVMAGRATIDTARIARFQELLEAAGAADAATRAVDVAATYRATYAEGWYPVPGAVELLTALRLHRITVVIVTNNVVLEQREKLRRCGLGENIDALVTSEEVGIQKPDPRIFQHALHVAGAQPAEAVMLGDAWIADIEGARAAGVRAVWFNRFHERSADPSVRELYSLEPTPPVLDALLQD